MKSSIRAGRAARVVRRLRPSATQVGLLGLLVAALGAILGASSVASAAERSPASLQRTLDGLRERLGISLPVLVAIVDGNPRIVSVVPASGDRPFIVEIDAAFAGRLSEDELAAALAHELGHVWVSTHHPFLQTERLANEVAMRVVTRESLARVYRKMWARLGSSRDEAEVLGPEILRVTRRSDAE